MKRRPQHPSNTSNSHGTSRKRSTTPEKHPSKRPEHTPSQQKRNHKTRQLRLLATTLIALIALVVVAALLITWNNSHEQNQSATTPSTDTAQSQEPAPSPTPKNTPTPDLSWRDTDFAVDPAKTTWSFEPNGEKTVYLTFDDGPSQNTEKVLKVLDDYDVKATFFVVGLSPEHYSWIGEAYRRGHTIGLHTYSHDYAGVYASTDAYYADLDKIGAVVKEQIGYVPAFIRFPGGSSNTISRNYTSGIMSELSHSVQERGYQYYDWTGSCGDGADHPADVLISEATKFGDQENIILLMHDSQAKDTTVEALPKVIEYYKNLGYTFKALDRNAMVPHHGIGN
ncbi:MAG: polysaccharide deacetylase [Actinomycetaceae bacterium]|nr:polysaccharide deacetylase [Actinomycetaceae bacterium]